MTHQIQSTHWSVGIELGEEDGQSVARASLQTDDPTNLTATGTAYLSPKDPYDVPEIGYELAAGRALVALGERLLTAGSDDVQRLLHPDTGAETSIEDRPLRG